MDRMQQLFRFRPSDEEIMEIMKATMDGFSKKYVTELDFLEFEPWEIQSSLSGGSNGNECHFLTPLKFKYANSNRQDRSTRAGYWKITSKKSNIMNLGIKRILVFHEGRVPDGKRTSYIVHAYERNDLKGYAYCRLFNKKGSDADADANANRQGEPSTYRVSSSDDHVAYEEYPQQGANQEEPAACYPMDTLAPGYMHISSPARLTSAGEEYNMNLDMDMDMDMDMNMWDSYGSYGQCNYALDDANNVAELFNN